MQLGSLWWRKRLSRGPWWQAIGPLVSESSWRLRWPTQFVPPCTRALYPRFSRSLFHGSALLGALFRYILCLCLSTFLLCLWSVYSEFGTASKLEYKYGLWNMRNVVSLFNFFEGYLNCAFLHIRLWHKGGSWMIWVFVEIFQEAEIQACFSCFMGHWELYILQCFAWYFEMEHCTGKKRTSDLPSILLNCKIFAYSRLEGINFYAPLFCYEWREIILSN